MNVCNIQQQKGYMRVCIKHEKDAYARMHIFTPVNISQGGFNFESHCLYSQLTLVRIYDMFYCVHLTSMLSFMRCFNPKRLPVLLLQGQNPLKQPGVKWLPQGLSDFLAGLKQSRAMPFYPLHDPTVKIIIGLAVVFL